MNAGTRSHPHQGGVDDDRQCQPDAEHPHERDLCGDQRRERDRHHQRGGGHDAARAGQAERDGLVVVRALVLPANDSQYSRIRLTRNTS